MTQKIITQTNMRETNLMEVLQLIREHGELTRRQLQQLAGLSWGGISQIVSRLLEHQFLIEEKQGSAGPGRKPLVLKINKGRHFVLGIDVNKSCLTAVTLNLCNEQVEMNRVEADWKNRNTLLQSIFDLLDPLVGKYREKGILSVGVSMQSMVDEAKGISICLEDCDGWEDVPVRDLLSRRYELPVFVTHDPDCLVASNVAAFDQNVILFRIDYGIGMSVYREGFFYKGTGLLEIGHTLAGEDGETLAAYTTIPGIEKRSGMKMEKMMHMKPELLETYLSEAARYMATAIINTAILFQIDQILVCGKMMEIYPTFFNALEQQVQEKKKKMRDYLPKGVLHLHAYDVNKAAAGAALIALEIRMHTVTVNQEKWTDVESNYGEFEFQDIE